MSVSWPKLQLYLFLLRRISLQLKQLATVGFIALWGAINGLIVCLCLWWTASLRYFQKKLFSQKSVNLNVSCFFHYSIAIIWLIISLSTVRLWFPSHDGIYFLFPFLQMHFLRVVQQNKFNIPLFYFVVFLLLLLNALTIYLRGKSKHLCQVFLLNF